MRKIVLFIVVFLIAANNVYARDLKVSLPLLPPVINKDSTGLLADFIRLLDKNYTEGKFEITGIYPFPRSVHNVGRSADIHWPSLEKPAGLKNVDIMYTSETFYKVNFVLYTKKGSKVTLDNLKDYKIASQRGQEEYFPFDIRIVDSLAGGLKMVNANRLDGLIFSMFETDAALKASGLTDIERTLYKKINVKMILENSEKGKEVDKIITGTMKKIRENGEYDKLMGFLIHAEFKKH